MSPDEPDAMEPPGPWALPLDGPTPTRASVGGKAANLGRLAAAGLPVPPGFVVTTDAFRAFVAANHLEGTLQPDRILGGDVARDVDVEAARIQDRFAAGTLPPTLDREIQEAYDSLGGGPVAVRSSAVLEDAVDRSFAGMADTALDVVDVAAVTSAIVGCWSSLFSARALAYLRRSGERPADLGMAVIVQAMIDADVSGVLFTADPITGRRTEMLVEATFGSGAPLVSGQVEPDRYRLDAADGRLLDVSLGSKTIPVGPPSGGSTETVDEPHAPLRRALTDLQLSELADLGRETQRLLPGPQDIEWAVRGDGLYVLQSRPITSLYPVPEELGPDPLHVFISYAANQGVTDPITPLGQDGIQLINLGAGRAFGMGRTEDDQLFRVAGGRLWMDVTRLFRSRIGRRFGRALVAAFEPGAQARLRTLEQDDRLAVSGGLPPSWLPRVVRRAVPMLVDLVVALARPERQRRVMERAADQQLTRAEARFASAGSLEERVAVAEQELVGVFEHSLGFFVPRYWAGAAAQMVLHLLARGVPRGAELALTATRGLPHNVTTAMGLELWRTAEVIRGDPEARRSFLESSPEELAEHYLAGTLLEPAQSAVTAFLGRYGMRGVGEVDLGRARWSEEPAPIIQALQRYQQTDDAALNPDVQFAQAAGAADGAIRDLTSALRGNRAGWLRAELARVAAGRMRALTGLRELPKFLSVNVRGFARRSMLESGRELVAAGILDRADDVFFLHFRELERLARDDGRDWKGLVADRRAAHAREFSRRQIPRLLLSDGQVFYESADVSAAPDDEGASILVGDPVSPGVVEGSVRVLDHPDVETMTPGEILVCRGADPGWTPLLLVAGGLVMETGGVMTHGSVVAREYGVPAVAGVLRATERLENGQRVRLDGTRGRIETLT